MKDSEVMEVSGIHNPEKPQKTKYSLKSSPTNAIGECMAVVQRWLAAQGRERSFSTPALPAFFDFTIDSARHSPLPPDSDIVSKCFLARALFEYAASDDHSNEISFPAGATISVAEQAHNGWWRGCVEGCSDGGWFPSNFVRPMSSIVVTEKPVCVDAAVLFYAIAVHDYLADDSETEVSSALKELTIRTNDAIAVTATDANGWWFGVGAGGESGWFPSNYVEILS
jgi:hypothetical protein